MTCVLMFDTLLYPEPDSTKPTETRPRPVKEDEPSFTTIIERALAIVGRYFGSEVGDDKR